jgi:hypothetical protein
MAEEIIVRKIQIEVDGAVQNLEMVEASTDKVTQSTGQLEKGLGDVPGPLGKVQQGVRGLSKAFKALLANPIVLILAAIVAALAALFKAFTKTQAGADKMKEVFSAISATIEVLTERAAKLFKALGKLFKGDFKGAAEDAKAAVSGVKDEIIEATRAAVEFERATRRLFEAETEIITVNAKRRQQIEELVFLTRDLTKSHEERRNAIVEAGKIEDAILQDNIALQEKRIELAKQEIINTPEQLRTREQSRKLAEEEAKLIDLQTASGAKQRELKNRLNEIDAKAASDRKAAAAADLAVAKEEEARLAEEEKLASERRKEERELELMLEEEFNKAMSEMNAAMADETKAMQDEATANFIENAEKEAAAAAMAEDQKRQAKQATLNFGNQILADGFSALLGFLGEESKIAKGIQVADATRAAIMGAIQAYQSAAAVPIVGAVLGPIAAAAALAAGMANVKKIAQTPDPLGGATPVPAVSIARPSGNIGGSDLLNQSQGIPTDVNIIQDSVRRDRQKAYVVQSDMTAEQDIERQRLAESTL